MAHDFPVAFFFFFFGVFVWGWDEGAVSALPDEPTGSCFDGTATNIKHVLRCGSSATGLSRWNRGTATNIKHVSRCGSSCAGHTKSPVAHSE